MTRSFQERSAATTVSTLLLLALAAVLIHAPHAIFNVADQNNDFEVHYRWTVQFSQALHDGNPYPRWMDLPNFGLGEPALLFYSPLYFYIASLFNYVTHNSWNAMRLVELLATVLSGWFVFLLLRSHGVGSRLALLGAVSAQATPMIYMLFHYFNGFPWAVSFTPLTALSYFLFRREDHHDRWVNVPAALALALLIMTHTVSALMVLICFSFIVFAHVRHTADGFDLHWKGILSWFLTATLGLGISMVYLFPALTSMVLISPEVWTTSYTPYDAFAFSTVTYFLFGMRWFTFQWVVPGVSLLAVGFATYYYWHRRHRLPAPTKQITLMLLSASWASLFFATELSYPLWLVPSPLQKVQFPHRFLYVTALTGTLANLLCLWNAKVRHSSRMFLVGLVPVGLSLLLTLALNLKISTIDAAPLRLVDQELKPYSGLAEYRLETRGSDWKHYLDQGGLAGECERAGISCEELPRSGPDRVWYISSPGSGRQSIRLPVFYFPAWEIQLTGDDVPISPDPATGLITVEVPPGDHRIVLSWRRMAPETIGLWLTIIALTVAGFLLLRRPKTPLRS